MCLGSDLESINKQDNLYMNHAWSGATWRASEEDWYQAHGTLCHDITAFGVNIPFTKVFTEFTQVGTTLNNYGLLVIMLSCLLLYLVIPYIIVI